jgi:hypothetical protein
MFFALVKWVLISLTLIFLIHHLYMFLMNTLTVPKIKDLVHKPNQQYKDILDTLGGKPPTTPLPGELAPTSRLNSDGGTPPTAPPTEFRRDGSGDSFPSRGGTPGAGFPSMGGVGGANPPDIGAELSSFLNDLKKTPSNKKNVNDFESLSNESGYSLY